MEEDDDDEYEDCSGAESFIGNIPWWGGHVPVAAWST